MLLEGHHHGTPLLVVRHVGDDHLAGMLKPVALADRLREAWADAPGTEAVTTAAFGDGPRLGLKPPPGEPPATGLTI